MSRQKVNRVLPPIQQVLPDFRGLPTDQSHKQYLVEQLRGIAKKLRKDKAQVFYSMRDLSRFFKAPLRTIALVYAMLEKEGMLSRIRGSQTLLTGKKNNLRFPVRGVVGIPIWLKMMVLSSFTRKVNMKLEEELRQRGYVADLIFHNTKEEEALPGFAERLLQHQLDFVVWQNPSPQSYQNLLSLRDSGIRVIVVQTTNARTDLPAVIYVQDWEPAHYELGRHWKELGINRVVIPYNFNNIAFKWEPEVFKTALESEGLAVEFYEGEPSGLLKACKPSNDDEKVGLAFIDMPMANLICNEHPLLLQKLARKVTLAFCRGPLRVPFLERLGVKPYVVGFSAEEMAQRIVNDIQKLPGISDGVRHTFHARFWREDIRDDGAV